MTISERNNKLKHFITCLKCEVSGKCCDDNCSIQYDAGNMGEIIENLEAISKVLEQEPKTKIEESNFSQEQYLADIQSAYDCGKSVIDKIRAEIIELRSKQNVGVLECLDIIDKYKGESEDKE